MIAHDNDVLVSVKVEVRSPSVIVPPQDLIIPRKRKRLTIAAEAYISEINRYGEIRFGAITFIYGKSDNIKDAFWNYTYE